MFLLLFSLLTISLSAEAKLCEVYGISDSPQRLNCFFPETTVKLRCVQGKYFLNSSEVKVAFHMDVTEGATPLVFKASDMTLTVLMERQILADLETQKAEIQGTCRR